MSSNVYVLSAAHHTGKTTAHCLGSFDSLAHTVNQLCTISEGNDMPLYASRHDLPAAIRRVLPPAAQDLYMSAYNIARSEYDELSTKGLRIGAIEATAHRMAWAAVKTTYNKTKGHIWHRK